MTHENIQISKSLWQRTRLFVREALRDNETDFTVGPINRALGLLAIPMMLEMAMEAIFAVVDIAFVSRLGTNAIAAVGLTEALITVLYAVAIGLGMGVTAMISRRIGAKDAEEAAQVAGQAVWVGAVLSIVIGISGYHYAAELLLMMGASQEVLAQGEGFTAILLGGSASIIFLFLLNAAFRGAGDAPVALRSLALANGINIILDPCLIFGLWSVPGNGRNRRGGRDDDWSRRGCGLPFLLPVHEPGSIALSVAAFIHCTGAHQAHDQGVIRWCRAIPDYDSELDRDYAYCGFVRQCADRRLYDRTATSRIRYLACMGPWQCSRDTGRAESRCRPT